MYLYLRKTKVVIASFLVIIGLVQINGSSIEGADKIRVSPNSRGGYNYYQGSKQIINSSKNKSGGYNYYEKSKFIARSNSTVNGERVYVRGDLRSGLGRTVIYGKSSLGIKGK